MVRLLLLTTCVPLVRGRCGCCGLLGGPSSPSVPALRLASCVSALLGEGVAAGGIAPAPSPLVHRAGAGSVQL